MGTKGWGRSGYRPRPSRAALAVMLFLPMVGSTLPAAAEGGGKKGKGVLPVRITIAPGKRDPWIDPVLAEPVPVVVYGEPRLDVRDIDPASLVLAGSAATKDDDGSLASYRDVDGDGTADLVVRFPSTRMHLGERSTRAVLGGHTTDGRFLRGIAPIATLDRARADRRLAARFDANVEKLPPLTIGIDVLPEDPTNRIELGNRGTIAVAVLSDPGFDATRLDPLALHLAGAPVTRRVGGGLSSVSDVNGDGRADLVVEVPRKLLRLDADSHEAVLTGFTAQGRMLWGTDPIWISETATMVFDSDDAVAGPEPSGVDFHNNLGITINDLAPAAPYPSTIGVAGLPGVISKVRVTLRGLSHTFADDIDVLLVGPTGQNLVLMSDVGGGNPGVTNVSLTFDDDAALALDPAIFATTGTYRPTNFVAGDTFAAPAPAPTAATSLSAFTGTNPNGTWSLYVVDDAGGDAGTISGWSIDFVLASEFCNGGAITINDAAPAAPYPSTIAVAGLSGIVSKVTASLRGLTHTFPDDIDLLLVGPTGLTSMVLSDTAGQNPGVNGVNLVLDDNAPLTLDTVTNPASGTYQPGDGIPGESLPAPAPAGPYPLGLRVYNGTNPNGTWNVYVADDTVQDVGSIGRVCLAITTMTPIDDSNLTAITIPAGAPGVTSGPASPYPSLINVTGVIGTLQKVTVTLRPLSHTFPQDLDILLAGPSGGNVLLMSDVGGGNPGVAGVAYTFDDDGAPMPVAANPPSGTYRPSNDDSAGPDALPGPAPAGPYGSTLAGLAGLSPNGAWRLFVFDDFGGDVGSLASGWAVTLRTWLRPYGGCNVSAMTIPGAGTSGPSSAYPAGIVQIGVPVDLDQYKVRVDLVGVTHTYPRDLDVLIVGPQGQKVLLMSDAAGTGPGVNNVNLSFDDDAAAGLLEFTNPTAGVFRPSDFEPGDVMPAPAPAGPYATSLSAFKGTNPLGSWALYVADDAIGDVGSLNGWCLNFVPSISAGVTPNLRWADKTTVVWDAAPNATSYNLYRGDPGQLPAYTDPNLDSCARGTTLTQQIGGLVEVPAPGSFYHYVVRANNAQGEGPAGSYRLQGQDLARVQNSSGLCP